MGRRPKYDRKSIVDAVIALVAQGGPKAATIGAIASRLGAPTGSIYHRYRSRELLLAEIWLALVEEFQEGLLSQLEGQDVEEAAVEAALFVPRWVRQRPTESRLLLLHHRNDFVKSTWPDEVKERAARLEPQLNGGLKRYCRRRYGDESDSNLMRIHFAVLDVPYGAVKPYAQAHGVPPPQLDELIRKTCQAVL